MTQRTFSQRIRNKVSPIADGLGIGSWMRQAFVDIRLSGEQARFALEGRPKPTNAIFLAGSGRSGTTWITDVLCSLPAVQQIFEPLFPVWNETVRDITGWDQQDPYFRSIYLRPNDEYPAWEQLWRKILLGQFRNYWTDYERNSYFPNRFMIKEIRANMMLAYLYRHFQLRIVYILRHPCAVVHSRLATSQPWHADVQDILMQKLLVTDHLKPWADLMSKEMDPIETHAVWWAVENHVALHQLRTVPHYLVYYEDLVCRPQEILKTLLPWLGFDKLTDKVFAHLPQPSRMSNDKLVYENQQDRLSRWQSSIARDDQQRILRWAERLGLTMYDNSLQPKNRSMVYAA